MSILSWDIYEIRSSEEMLHGVMLRGRIRKFCVENKINCLVENASDKESVVRFAVLTGVNYKPVHDFIMTIVPTVDIVKVLENVVNPVLSKLKVNDLSRYSL